MVRRWDRLVYTLKALQFWSLAKTRRTPAMQALLTTMQEKTVGLIFLAKNFQVFYATFEHIQNLVHWRSIRWISLNVPQDAIPVFKDRSSTLCLTMNDQKFTLLTTIGAEIVYKLLMQIKK